MKKTLISFLLILILIILYTTTVMGDDFKIIINFDDGYRGVYEKAFPLLKEYNFPAVAFVTTNYLGQERHMDINELQELKTAGWEIGSHTVHHPDLRKLIPSGIKKELVDSKNKLLANNLLTDEYASFCSPMSAWNEKIAAIAAEEYNLARGDKLYLLKENRVIPASIKIVISSTDPEEIKHWIKKANNQKIPLVLVFHEIDNNNHIFTYPQEDFAKLLRYIDRENYAVSTYQQLFENNEFRPDIR